MQIYKANQKKHRKAIRQIIRANVKHSKGAVKFCYGLTMALRVLAILLGLANILYVAFRSKDALDLIFLIMTFGFPYGLSFLSATVYIVVAGGEYRLREKELIVLEQDGFKYFFQDARTGLANTIFSFNIAFKDVSKYYCDGKTKILTLNGKFHGETFENGELKASDEYNEISLLDTFDFSIKELLDKNW